MRSDLFADLVLCLCFEVRRVLAFPQLLARVTHCAVHDPAAFDCRTRVDLFGPGHDVLARRLTPSAHEYLYFIDGQQLFAVRDQRFKYRGPAGVFYSNDQMNIGFAVPQKEWLFDLNLDPQESYDVSARHPEVLSRLREAFELKRETMLTNPRGWDQQGSCRPPGG